MQKSNDLLIQWTKLNTTISRIAIMPQKKPE